MTRRLKWRCCIGIMLIGAAGFAATANNALAQSFDGKWTGDISCAKLSFTKGTMKAQLDMAVASGKATYARDVFNADGTRVVGTEEGSGTVAANGAIKLTAIWKSVGDRPRYTYTASYNGTLSGNQGTLRGTQIWTFDNKTENRACSIVLKH
jgi:hypothetical protein